MTIHRADAGTEATNNLVRRAALGFTDVVNSI